MSELRTLLEAAQPRDDAGFDTAAALRRRGDARRRAQIAVAAVAAVCTLVVVPLALRPGTVETPPAGPTPVPTGTTSFADADLAGTEWRVDLRASGITDDPVAVPTSVPDGTGLLGLGAIVLLDDEGRLRLRNGYVGAGPLPAGTWRAADQTETGGALSFTLTSAPQGWDQDPQCTPTRCRDGALPYWPGVEAFSRLESVVRYELAPVPRGEVMPLGPTIGMSMLDARDRVVLCLVLIARDGEPVGVASP